MTEPVAGALDFEPHHRAERGSVLTLGDVLFTDSKAAQVLKRKIDAAFGVINADILPEIRELQSGTGEIGKLLPLRVAIPAEIEDKVTYRIGRVVAIAHHVVEGFKTCDGLILAKGGQKIGELMRRYIELPDGFSQRNKHRMFRGAPIARLEFTVPLVEQFQRSGGVTNFVSEVIRDTAVGVDVEKMLA